MNVKYVLLTGQVIFTETYNVKSQSISNAMYITRKYKLYVLPAMNLQVLVTNNKKYFQVE